jgi:hypothetical protein
MYHRETAQRIHHLLGSLQWFADVLTVTSTVLLLLTCVPARPEAAAGNDPDGTTPT